MRILSPTFNPTDVLPVFIGHVGVDTDGAWLGVVAVLAVLLAAANPILVGGLRVVEVPADAASDQPAQGSVLVVCGVAGTGEADPADPGFSRFLVLHIHDAGLLTGHRPPSS